MEQLSDSPPPMKRLPSDFTNLMVVRNNSLSEQHQKNQSNFGNNKFHHASLN